jgi:prepilin-type N-terminal cleavage/methylation domain-containing protein
MTHRQRRRNARPAFTMIELLVVMTIIAILVALLSTAVMRSLAKGPELQTSSEIGELQAKLANVVSNPANPLVYLPSRLHLSKKNNYTSNPKSAVYNPASPNFALDRDSMAFLQARFGKHTCFDFASPPGQIINWNGDPNDPNGNQELYLEGQQCLVFHLAGVPTYNAAGDIAMVGFSNDSQNPAKAATAGEKRQGPYFEFQSNRLKLFTSAAFGSTGAFPIYFDIYTRPGGNTRQPFAFFASYSTEGGGLYDKYGGTSDCPSLLLSPPDPAGTPLLPYQPTGSATFLNPSSFQIISAGRDGKFGAGGQVWGRTGTVNANGADDQSNFSSHLLGIAP